MPGIAYQDSRIEEILKGTYTGEPQSRVEALLMVLVASGGSGGSGTTNYNYLLNTPKINGVDLKGDKSLAELGIVRAIREEINSIDFSATAQTAVENYLLANPVTSVTEDRVREIIEGYNYLTQNDMMSAAEIEALFV